MSTAGANIFDPDTEVTYFRVPKLPAADWVCACFVCAAVSLILILAAAGIGHELIAPHSVALAIVAPTIIAGCIIYFIWKLVFASLARDRITLGPATVTLGAGKRAATYPYSDVDLFELSGIDPPDDRYGLGVRFARSAVSI